MGREGNDGRCYLPLRVPPPFAFSIVGLPDLEPQEHAAAPVRCRLIFADKALVSSLRNLPPRLQAVSCLRRPGLVTISLVARGLGRAMVTCGGPTLDHSRHSRARRRGLPGTIAGNTAILRREAGASCLATTWRELPLRGIRSPSLVRALRPSGIDRRR